MILALEPRGLARTPRSGILEASVLAQSFVEYGHEISSFCFWEVGNLLPSITMDNRKRRPRPPDDHHSRKSNPDAEGPLVDAHFEHGYTPIRLSSLELG
jgi:hypothetical protein